MTAAGNPRTPSGRAARPADAREVRPRSGRCARIAGFTMLELLVVIVLIGVLAAISPPIFSNGVSAAEHRALARSVAQTLRFARSEAVANRTDVGVEFNLQDRTFQLPGGKRKGKWPENIALELTTTAAETVDETHAYVRFYADGGSTGGRVTLKYKEREYRIDISWLTGHIAIEEA